MQIFISKKFMIMLGILVVIFISSVGVVYRFSQNGGSKITMVLSQTSAGFKTYYPSTLPVGYEIDENSVYKNSDVIFYTLKNPKTSEYITISQQSVPQNLNPEAILRQPNKEPTKLAIGTMYDKSSTDQKIYVIATNDNVLIYVNPSNKAESSTIQSVITALEHYK